MICIVLFLQQNKSHYRTLITKRTFTVDGEIRTTEVQKIVVKGEENKTKEDHELW